MITYQVLSENILIIYQGQPFSIPKSDKRYNVVKENLHDLKPEHFTLFNELPSGFKFVDGSLYFHKFQIPAKLEPLFFSSTQKDAFVNFWANIVSRHDFDVVCEISKYMEKDQIRPISKDGFLVYKAEKIPDLLSKDFITSSIDIQSIEEELEQSFPKEFVHKREFMAEIKSIAQTGLDLNYLSFLGKITSTATLDDTVSVLKNKPLQLHPEVCHDITVELVLTFIKNKSNTFSKNRFDSFLAEPDLIKMVSCYNLCRQENVEFDFSNTSFSSALKMVEREIDRLDLKGYDLKITNNHPETKCLNELIVLENHKLIIPQLTGDLVSWGSVLKNCVGNGSYAKNCQNGGSYILGLLDKDQRIKASIEVQVFDSLTHQICQFEEKENGTKRYVSKSSPKWKSIQNEINRALIEFSKDITSIVR